MDERQPSQRELADIMRAVGRYPALRSLRLENLASEHVTAALPQHVQQQLHTLTMSYCSLSAANSIAACTALQQLTVEYGMFRRWHFLMPQLAALTSLRSLNIRADRSVLQPAPDDSGASLLESALGALPGLTHLTLTFGDGDAGDISDALSGLVSLRELNLDGTFITVHTHALSHLAALERLHVKMKCTGELEDLSGLTQLSSLTLWYPSRDHDDLCGLETLTSLTELDMHDFHASDECITLFTYMLDMTALRILRLCMLRSPEPKTAGADTGARDDDDDGDGDDEDNGLQLVHLTGLQSLSVRYCGTWDISPLASLHQLTHLTLGEVGGDISPLSALTSLLDLNLDGRIGDLTPLQQLGRLQQLTLENSGASSLEPLSNLTALTELTLFRCVYVKSLQPLAPLSRLQKLNVSICGATSLAPLTGLTSLQELRLREMYDCTGWETLAPLTALQRLSLVHCAGQRDLERLGLSGMTQLQDLYVADCSRWQG